jgi:8-oxo-dGTP pyrophosphatase MutT (NUDIX family)
MSKENICQLLRERLSRGVLPGAAAQLQMSPFYPDDDRSGFLNPPRSSRLAAVLILITPPFERPSIPLIPRTEDGGVHSGQIAMPGGSLEGAETYPVETALREAREEIGLAARDLELLGSLSPLYIPVSGFLVTPVLACTGERPELRPDGLEAKEILWFDLKILLREPPVGSFKSRNRGRVQAPFYPFRGGKVWGATAMMLSELAELLKEGKILSAL